MRLSRFGRGFIWAVCVSLLAGLFLPDVSHAKTAREIDASVSAALDRLTQQVTGSGEFIQGAKGVLVFAGVYQGGMGMGGQYGEGALRVRGQSVGYYRITSTSIGFQLGPQEKDIILVFLQDKALVDFRAKDSWRAGVDGSVVLVDQGTAASVNTTKFHQPIVGFVVGRKGFVHDLTLHATEISKMQKWAMTSDDLWPTGSKGSIPQVIMR
jgi:lipid-binding SYLF domain-containing protein